MRSERRLRRVAHADRLPSGGAERAQVAAGADYAPAGARLDQCGDREIDRVAFGDAAQVERDRRGRSHAIVMLEDDRRREAARRSRVDHR
jgi:hypothetical protein